MENTAGPGSEREHAAANTRRGDVPADTFAVRLVLSRHHAGRVSQREAAETCGLNYASWSNWENGMRPRDILDVCQAVAQGLGMDEQWLLFGGPLEGPRGRLVTKRPVADTISYQSATVRPTSVRPTAGRPDGRGDTHAPKVSRPVVRTHSPSAINDLVAATGSR